MVVLPNSGAVLAKTGELLHSSHYRPLLATLFLYPASIAVPSGAAA